MSELVAIWFKHYSVGCPFPKDLFLFPQRYHSAVHHLLQCVRYFIISLFLFILYGKHIVTGVYYNNIFNSHMRLMYWIYRNLYLST